MKFQRRDGNFLYLSKVHVHVAFMFTLHRRQSVWASNNKHHSENGNRD